MAQVLNTGHFRASWNARVLVNCTGGLPNGTVLKPSTWKCDPKTSDINTVNFSSAGASPWLGSTVNSPNTAGFSEGISGVTEVGVSFGGDWDAGFNPYDGSSNPPGIYPRDDLTGLVFVQNVPDQAASAGLMWFFKVARLRTASNGAQIGQAVKFDASGFNQGPFVAPFGMGN